METGVLNATFFLSEAFTGDLAHLPDQLRGLVVETDANDCETTFYSRSGRPLPTWNLLTGQLTLRQCNPHFAPLNVKTLANVIAFTSRPGAVLHDGERGSLWPSTVRPVDAAGDIVDFVNTRYYRVRLTAPMLRAMDTTAGTLANSARGTVDGGSIGGNVLTFEQAGNELFVSASDGTIVPVDLTIALGTETAVTVGGSNSCALDGDRLLIQVPRPWRQRPIPTQRRCNSTVRTAPRGRSSSPWMATTPSCSSFPVTRKAVGAAAQAASARHHRADRSRR